MYYFQRYAPKINYVQYGEITCCFTILVSDMYYAREYVTEREILSRLKSSLFCESFGYMYRSKFENKNIADCVRTNSKQCRCFELV